MAGSSQRIKMGSPPKICVICCTFNGEKYIREQLESLLNQTVCSLSIFIFDDQSTDRTVSIITEYENDNKNRMVRVFQNKRHCGSPVNFIDALNYVCPNYDYYAFCDQDDIWLENKIEHAIRYLADPHNPALYFSNVTSVNADNSKVLETSNIVFLDHNKKTGFLSNPAPGNTIVFTNALLGKIKFFDFPKKFPHHDWWVYIVALFCDADILFDKRSFIFYRQHAGNRTGDGRRLGRKFRNLFGLLSGSRKGLIIRCVDELLASGGDLISADDRHMLQKIRCSMAAGPISRAWLWKTHLQQPRKGSGIVIFFGLVFGLL